MAGLSSRTAGLACVRLITLPAGAGWGCSAHMWCIRVIGAHRINQQRERGRRERERGGERERERERERENTPATPPWAGVACGRVFCYTAAQVGPLRLRRDTEGLPFLWQKWRSLMMPSGVRGRQRSHLQLAAPRTSPQQPRSSCTSASQHSRPMGIMPHRSSLGGCSGDTCYVCESEREKSVGIVCDSHY